MSTIALMDIIATDKGTKRLMPSLQITDAALSARCHKRTRRAWSDEEKQRIVAEAMVPGASVADVARHYGANANLVFTWRRAALAAAAGAAAQPDTASVQLPPETTSSAPEPCEFIPIGVFVRTEDEVPALATGSSAAPNGKSASRQAAAHPAMEERAGLIEIDLADGTRLRVDAFVNERALRRVLTVLKATS
jgi:transposase